MKKAFTLMILVALFTSIIAGCSDNIPRENSQAKIDALRALRPTEIPDHFADSDSKQPGDFDVNSFFSIFQHVKMEPGYTLDYYYWGQKYDDGRPFIYARKSEDRPLTTNEGENILDGRDWENIDDFVALAEGENSNTTDNKIRIDGTADGYVEYVILQIMGDQFYLSWHANYNDATAICEKESLRETIDSSCEGIYAPPDDAFLIEAEKIDFQPKVIYKDKTVIVDIIIFTKWGGLIRESYTISRKYPHEIIDVKDEILVEYHCGVMF